METHIGVAVAVLYAYNHVSYDSHARPVSKELLICRLRVILLGFYKLMVEVNVIRLTFL